MNVDANVNDVLLQRLPRRCYRGSTWREALARKQSRLLAEFLRKNSASKLADDQEEMASQDLDVEVHIQTTLSYDLLYQIFILLPAESLFRLQFVCKQWFSLINSTVFVSTHAQQTETVLISQQLSFWPRGSEGKPKSYFHFLSLDDWGSSFVESSVAGLFNVRASYDGLILASTGRVKRLILINPVTGKHIELPLGAACHPLCESFGIAFCNQSKMYKVVHLFREISGSIGCEILSIRTRNWTRIEGPPELLRIRQIPVSIDGSLYWLSSKRGRDYFVSLNVHDEKFVSKKLPVKRVGSDRLLEIGGNLGFVTHAELSILQVWILISDGESRECWMRRYSINMNVGFTHCIPICSRRNGQELVLESIGNQLYLYNFDRDEIKPVNSGSDDEPWFGKINRLYIPHQNTLVSCGNHNLITL
ncbi:hypothetical protein C2S51_016412 [Perilla frutescens var. frutescens]|nr:hypothetical protein C2S51_016412 [Perilla frutescens var. frutescens]